MSLTYQTRRHADAAWLALNGSDPWAPLGVVEAMQKAGFRYSEIAGHLDDLHAGHVLTAENGRQFRALTPRHARAVERDGRQFRDLSEAAVTNTEIREATAPGYSVSPGISGSDAGKWLAYGPGGWIVSRRATWQEAAADTQAAVARAEGRGWAVSR